MCWNPLVRGCRCKKYLKKRYNSREGGGRGKRERKSCLYISRTYSFSRYFRIPLPFIQFLSLFYHCVCYMCCNLWIASCDFRLFAAAKQISENPFQNFILKEGNLKVEKNRRTRILRQMDIVKNNCGASDIFDFSERHSKQFC